jgi:glycosyltransferase involved in cell wall biosynthesis
VVGSVQFHNIRLGELLLKLRILHITDRVSAIGGAEKDLQIHLQAIADSGHEGFIATCEEQPEFGDDPRIHFVPRRMGFRDSLEGAARILEIIRGERIDICHVSNLIDFLGSRGLAELATQLPIVRTIQDVRPTCHRGSRVHPRHQDLCLQPHGWRCLSQSCIDWSNAHERALDLRRFADAWISLRVTRHLPVILVYSHHSKRVMIANGVPADRIRVLTELCVIPGHAPDLPPPQPAPPREPRTVLSVGRLDAAKGQSMIVQVAARLQGSGIRFEIAGDGPLQEQIAAEARALGVAESVHLLGRPSDAELGQHMQRVGIVFIPSMVMETFSRTGVEANLCGRPVVTHRLGGPSEWLESGVNGIETAFGDLDAIATAIRTLADNPERAFAMGSAGWQRLRGRYTRQRMVADLISAYEEAHARWWRERL